jgi:hypothetical protein
MLHEQTSRQEIDTKPMDIMFAMPQTPKPDRLKPNRIAHYGHKETKPHLNEC